MGKRRTRTVMRTTAQVKRPKEVPASQPKQSFWHSRKVWFAGAGSLVLTGVVTGVLINVLTAQAQRIVPSPGSTVTVAPLNVLPQASPAGSRGDARKPPRASTNPPLTVLSEDPIDSGWGGIWVFPDQFLLSANKLNYLNSLNINSLTDFYALNNWLLDHGAYPPSTDTQLVVQNDRNYEIRILDINVSKSCSAPLTGTLFYAPPEAGEPDIRLGFNLDSDDTGAKVATGWDATRWKRNYFANETIPIQPGKQQVFNIRAIAKNAACTFRFQITILDGKKKVYQLIGDGNQPFRVSALTFGSNTKGEFSVYKAMYAGGDASPAGPSPTGLTFTRVNPKTFK